MNSFHADRLLRNLSRIMCKSLEKETMRMVTVDVAFSEAFIKRRVSEGHEG